MTTTMAENIEFKPLLDVGTLPVTDTSEIRFYVDEFKGYQYASMRTFVKRDGYSGPTKAGITMNPTVLDGVIAALEKLPPEPVNLEDVELVRVPKKSGLELVVRVTIYRDTTGIDLREWVDDGVYKGWSKKGVRVNYAELGKLKDFLGKMREFLKKKKA